MHIHDKYEPIRPLASRYWKTDLRSVTSPLWKPRQRTDYTYLKKEATSRKGEANVVGVRNVIKHVQYIREREALIEIGQSLKSEVS